MKYQHLQNKIILAQTDTTAGFLSKDYKLINKAKNRKISTPCLLTSAYLSEIQSFSRLPNKFKNDFRKAKKKSFILKNGFSFRLINDERHSKFLKKFGFFYSSSANKHGEKFDENWARKKADLVLDEILSEKSASSIFKLSRIKKVKLR